jgi:hypothetical protein
MYEHKDFIDSWQFRTVLVGSFIAAFGLVVCFLGIYIKREARSASSASLPAS